MAERNEKPQLKISIVMPVYNDEKFVGRALKSCLRQTYPNIEVVCVDDGSADASLSRLREFAAKDERVKVVALERNGGSHNARRAGLAQVEGDIVTFLDADDELKGTTCARIAREYAQEPFDVLHLATYVVGDGNVDDERVRDMAGWTRPLAERLEGRAILTRTYVDLDYAFNVAGKAFPVELARRAFDALGDVTADSSEDVLEYFAIAFFARTYRGLPQHRYYVYHLGDGGSGLADMSAADFARSLRSRRAVEAIREFLEGQGAFDDYADVYEAHRANQLDVLVRTWHNYVRPADKLECLQRIFEIWPRDEVIDAVCAYGSDAVEVLKREIGRDYAFSSAQMYACGVADGAAAERESILKTGTYRLGHVVGAPLRKLLTLTGR